MSRKLFTAGSILMLLVLVLTASGTPAASVRQQAAGQQVASAGKFDAHYRAPNEAAIALLLEEKGISLQGLTPEQKQAQIQAYEKNFHDRNPDTPDPEKLRKLLEKERLNASAPAELQAEQTDHKPVTDRSIKTLVVLMEFNPAEETWTSQTDAASDCVDTVVTMAGPLHNQIPAPGPRDNNTIWYQDTTPQLYNEIYFGEGPKAGVIVEHPNLGKVDLRGKTMVNYYMEMSGGKFAPAGEVYPGWFQAQHSEGWYGEDGCNGSHNVRASDLVVEAINSVKLDNPNFDWQSYDGNADGIVDNFTVIHAGMGQEAGGGSQGNFAIWSHASMVGWPDGVLVCEKGSTGCPDRNILVKDYSMDPENIDLGVISEEYGHAAFGLPDLYTTDGQGSISNWAIMEAGSWNGILGGMEPAPFPLWFKYLLGWVNVKELSYDSGTSLTTVGQLEKTPSHTYAGIKINLPDKVIAINNPLNSGNAWWSNVADGVNYSLTRDVDLTGATAPVLSFASDWSIEEDYDYGYVEVSADGGGTWDLLPDMDGNFKDTNPDPAIVVYGLTGSGQGTLRFDLAAYQGKQIKLRLAYITDPGVQWNGWFADDFLLADKGVSLWMDDVESGADAWTAEGWTLVPLTKTYPLYYLVEWRNNQGFDHGLKYPYSTVYYDEDEWQVDRAPYTVPGMLVYLRDGSYAFDYTLSDALMDAPSIGPKHGLLLVDSHFWPYEWSNFNGASGAKLRVNSRVQPGNAAFTLQKTTPFTLHLGYDPATGQYVDTPLETKKFGPLPAVSAFHDSLGYYPGFWYNTDPDPSLGGLWYWDWQSSLVVPAKDNYSTRVTWLDRSPLTDLYGADLGGGQFLGSGNPGDNGVQYGLHIAVLDKAKDGTYGKILTWNSSALTKVAMTGSKKTAGSTTYLTYRLRLTNSTPLAQNFVLTDTIPANTVFVKALGDHKKQGDAVVWKGTIKRGEMITLYLIVKVAPGTPAGTVITNNASVQDGALGSSATLDITR